MILSKYTIEVRQIVQGLADPEAMTTHDVIQSAIPKIFEAHNFYLEDYASVFYEKLLRHYWQREIGAETISQWLFWINRTLEEELPYFNKLYELFSQKFNPLYNVDYYRSGNRDENRTENLSMGSQVSYEGTSNGSEKNDSTTSNESQESHNDTTNFNHQEKNLFSDTPQGGLQGIESEVYLTDARIVTDADNTENSGGSSSSGSTTTNSSGKTEQKDSSSTETTQKHENQIGNSQEYLEHVFGNQGSSYGKLIADYVQNLKNIDMEFIEKFETCFMGLW